MALRKVNVHGQKVWQYICRGCRKVGPFSPFREEVFFLASEEGWEGDRCPGCRIEEGEGYTFYPHEMDLFFESVHSSLLEGGS